MTEKNNEVLTWEGGLDLDTVMRVANNEIDKIAAARAGGKADVHSEALRALAKSYLAYYEDRGAMICDEVFREAYRQLGEAAGSGESVGDLPKEFVCGRALAVAATNHAEADIADEANDFIERAVCCLRGYRLAPAGAAWKDVGADRMSGTDMSKEFKSAQHLTGAMVKEWVEDELSGADDVLRSLNEQDWCDIAKEYMDAQRDVEFDIFDVQDVTDRARTKSVEKAILADEAKETGRRPVVGVVDKAPAHVDGARGVDMKMDFISGALVKKLIAERLEGGDAEDRAVLNLLEDADYARLANGFMSVRDVLSLPDVDAATDFLLSNAYMLAEGKGDYGAEVESCREAIAREEEDEWTDDRETDRLAAAR